MQIKLYRLGMFRVYQRRKTLPQYICEPSCGKEHYTLFIVTLIQVFRLSSQSSIIRGC
ncbi:uncharacterized protein PGTG_05023 [Puccinia graminis f. sp. tritici CRL 75-36-700-3]|uniref:Uncharacterized protein n=1 Tax=Puccinia graminis f. sp. tritici (strain CRL 75-36-700-3 / race SCCL) TaxID=418459 RepID=E3K3L0_PUCGT|nr:uncharacterized protein PGTG_05023 [Puccinia graminis f. sp. tritici CRL 75-36-700-3]EFP79067.1 hypothetical protein PGTG_05023 [Puccinia graminis f. sp. tritici CRL 75-36-700-3]